MNLHDSIFSKTMDGEKIHDDVEGNREENLWIFRRKKLQYLIHIF